MKVLVACEFSGIVREAFKLKGHFAKSVDLLPSEDYSGDHYIYDALKFIEDYMDEFDLMIAHPPCTHLAISGAKWFKLKQKEQDAAIWFFMALINAPIEKICVENPVSIMSTLYRKPTQIIQPWMFGHGETKATCFWLKNLPKLKPTNVVEGREARVHKMAPSPDRWKERSRTYQGIADCMAAT